MYNTYRRNCRKRWDTYEKLRGKRLENLKSSPSLGLFNITIKSNIVVHVHTCMYLSTEINAILWGRQRK